MALYFIEYDLRKERDYQKLYEELKNFKAIQVLESSYCFKRYDTNAKSLREHFLNFVDSDDRLIVLQVKHFAGFNLINTPYKPD